MKTSNSGVSHKWPIRRWHL